MYTLFKHIRFILLYAKYFVTEHEVVSNISHTLFLSVNACNNIYYFGWVVNCSSMYIDSKMYTFLKKYYENILHTVIIQLTQMNYLQK